MPTYRIVIPCWHPPRVNQYEGRHWSAKHRAKKRAAQMIGLTARVFAPDIPRSPACGKRRVSLTIGLTPKGQEPDQDGWWDALLDALQTAGYLVDDSPRWCEIGTVTYERRPGWWGCEITLEDL